MTRPGQKLHTKEIFQAVPKASLQRQGKMRRLYEKRRLGLHLNSALKNAPSVLNGQVLCNTSSPDADTGVLSCGKGNFCKPSSGSRLGGVCTGILRSEDRASAHAHFHSVSKIDPLIKIKAPYKQEELLMECDPASIDVGILACEAGKFCKKADNSGLGGWCVPTSDPSRHLISLDDMISFCEPVLDYMTYGCDCSKLDATIGMGTIYCFEQGPIDYYGCDEVIMDNAFSVTFEDGVLSQLKDCYDTKVPYSLGFCIVRNGEYLDDSCAFEWNGQDCNSCVFNYVFFDFDCSNVDGGPTGSSIVDLSSIFEECYSAPNYTCTNLCGEGNYIPDFNFEIIVTYDPYGRWSCGQLAYWEDIGFIPDDACLPLMGLAQLSCCVPSNSTSPILNEDLTTAIPGLEENAATRVPGQKDDTATSPGIDALPSLASVTAATILLSAGIFY